MTQPSVGARRLAAVEIVGSRTARRVLAVLVFAVLTALGAYVAFPLPGTPVMVTLQTLFVTLSGALLGARLGATSQAAYLAAGLLGAPVFMAGGAGPAHLLGPTGGYLIAFPAAAAVTGVLAGRARGVPRLALAILIGSLVIFAGGAAQLAVLTGDVARAVEIGVLPFLPGDVVKVVLAALIASRLRDRTLGRL